MEVGFSSSDRETCSLYATVWAAPIVSRPKRKLVNSWNTQPDDNHNSKTDLKSLSVVPWGKLQEGNQIEDEMCTDTLISTMQKKKLKEFSIHNTMLCKQTSLDTASSTEHYAQNSTRMEKENKAKADWNRSLLLQDLALRQVTVLHYCSQTFDVYTLFYI